MSSPLPDAEYLVLASRLIPDLDGGFTISVLRRAQDMARSGARVRLLTVDVGTTEEHRAHRDQWRRRGRLEDGVELRNLFDDARTDAAWLRDGALPLETLPATGESRVITDDHGRTVLQLPVITGDPAWHLSTAPVIIWDENGAAPQGWLPGFGALYRAWLNRFAAQSADDDVVVLCESRQVGELFVADAVAPLAPAVRVVHTTHACHVMAPFRPDSDMDSTWTRWFALADRFDRVLWLTPTQQRDADTRAPGIRSSVVPHPVPGVGSNNPVPGEIAVMCSLIPRKRVADTLHALARVREVVPSAHLRVYGDGSQRQALQTLAGELGVSEAVTFHGHVADPEEAWSTADAFVLTSTNEGQPLVVLEALGHGVPVVSYDLPYGPRDTLAQGGGVLVADGDADALASALIEVIGDRDRRAALAREGREAAAIMDPVASMTALGVAIRAAIDEPASRPGR